MSDTLRERSEECRHLEFGVRMGSRVWSKGRTKANRIQHTVGFFYCGRRPLIGETAKMSRVFAISKFPS